MIPRRVKLSGFLCYRGEQEISLDSGTTLWMLSGVNGSGKSSVFDALTFALFAHHRGGGQHAEELINKDSDGLVVEFDFLLEDQEYRVKRTLKRQPRGGTKGTTQIFRRIGEGEGKGKWEAVEGTQYKDGFNEWVAEHIGLTYDTFTSSVLLLQGRAEKLLDSKPEGRRAVLASIVDLDRYERLFHRADESRKELEGAYKTQNQKLQMMPVIQPEQVIAAHEAIAAAERARDEVRERGHRLAQLQSQAQDWLKLQGRLRDLREKHRRAGELLAEQDNIQRAMERLAELRDVLPRMKDILDRRTEVTNCQREQKTLEEAREKVQADLTLQQNALGQAQDKKRSLQNLIAADAKKLEQTNEAFIKSTAALEKLKEYERHESDLNRLRDDQSRLPANPGPDRDAAQAEVNRLTELSQAVPLLERFQTRRAELRDAVDREARGKTALEEITARGKKLNGDLEQLKPQLDQATTDARQARDAATEARTLLQQAREALSEIGTLDGSLVCRHCGQPLTKEHLADENKKRKAALAAAEKRAKDTAAAKEQAEKREAHLAARVAQMEKDRQAARDEWVAAKGEAETAQKEVKRLRQECGQEYNALPPEYCKRISPRPPADWLETTFPQPRELAALRTQADGLGAAQNRLRQAEKVLSQASNLRIQVVEKETTLMRLQQDLPKDRASVRRQHTDLDTQKKTLDASLRDKQALLRDTEGEIERLSRSRDEAKSRLDRCALDLQKAELTRQNAEKEATTQIKQLPPAWQPLAAKFGLNELTAWGAEKKKLEDEGTESKARELLQAQLNRDALAIELTDQEKHQEDYPAEARQEPSAIQAQLNQARQEERQRDQDVSAARSHLERLERDRQEREQLEQDCLGTERELKEAKLLAELLGKDRLQLYLVRQAERQVVEHANAVLDRLSGGQLSLKLTGEAGGEGASAKALELESYNRRTGDKPINVAFLSGSQKFRVAVALALGIGQYASRQHRPIEAVIIDEGFGCLDSQGRQVMIQELQNLRNQMRCILLVSHQEDFADAFADGYHFELDETGATQVKRRSR